MFVFVPDMLDELRNSYSYDNDENYVPRFNLIKDSKILILDDFGSENYSKWAHEKLYQIITFDLKFYKLCCIIKNIDVLKYISKIK